jgi:hypothetical protein
VAGLADPIACLKAGLVPIKKTIVHKGKTMEVTYYVKPKKGAPVPRSSDAPASSPAPSAPAPKGPAPSAPGTHAPPGAKVPGPKKVPIKKTLVTKGGKKFEVTYHVSEKAAAKHHAEQAKKANAQDKPAPSQSSIHAPAVAPSVEPASAPHEPGYHPIKGARLVQGLVKEKGVSAAYDAVELMHGGNPKLASQAVGDWARSSSDRGRRQRQEHRPRSHVAQAGRQ